MTACEILVKKLPSFLLDFHLDKTSFNVCTELVKLLAYISVHWKGVMQLFQISTVWCALKGID